ADGAVERLAQAALEIGAGLKAALHRFLEVEAGAERTVGAGEHDRADVGRDAAHGGGDVLDDGGGEPVARRRAIDRDRPDCVAVLDLHIGHGLSSGVAGLGSPDGPSGSSVSNIHSSPPAGGSPGSSGATSAAGSGSPSVAVAVAGRSVPTTRAPSTAPGMISAIAGVITTSASDSWPKNEVCS